jgi:hypothetical protein
MFKLLLSRLLEKGELNVSFSPNFKVGVQRGTGINAVTILMVSHRAPGVTAFFQVRALSSSFYEGQIENH